MWLSQRRQEATRELWPKLVSEYEAHVSALVQEEAGRGDSHQAILRLEALRPLAFLDTDAAAKSLASESSRAAVSRKNTPQMRFTLP